MIAHTYLFLQIHSTNCFDKKCSAERNKFLGVASERNAYERLECEFHGAFEIDGNAFCVMLALELLLLLLLLVEWRVRITSLAVGQLGRGPGSGVYVNVNPVA